MKPIFNEEIKFLEEKGIELDLQEGYYWKDKQIIKCYDNQGYIHNIARLYIDDDLNITVKTYEQELFIIESWEETVKRNEDKLQKLETHSIELIKEVLKIYDNRTPVILSSGGKDSSVVSYLVKQVVSKPLTIFNNTTLDCADTYLYIKQEYPLLIINPKEGFYPWRERSNFVGNRTARACCGIFKEGAMVETLNKEDKYLFFMGMRNLESNTRSGYADLWKNNKWGAREWDGVLPIRTWSEEEVWLYTLYRNIPINPKYKKGYSRVGCAIACPYYTKSTWVLDKYWYPEMYERWHKILDKDFIENKKAPILNCTLKEYHIHWNDTSVREEATEEVKEEFSKITGIDRKISDKYFDKKCSCCDKKLKKDDVGLSMKYYGRHIEKFKCTKCISKEFGTTLKVLKGNIKDFKLQGCDLF